MFFLPLCVSVKSWKGFLYDNEQDRYLDDAI